ncbi:MAG: sensor domain-containing diguanylate cyclase [Rhodoferax sp.]
MPDHGLPQPSRLRGLLVWVLAWCLLAWVGAAAVAAPVQAIDLGASAEPLVEVGVRMQVLVDPGGTRTWQDVAADTQAWQPVQRPSPNYGFSTDTYWFRVELHNLQASPLLRWLELPVPFLDDVRFFHTTGPAQPPQGAAPGTPQLQAEFVLGDEFPFVQRVIQHPHFVVPLQLAPGDNTLYLRIASTGTVEASLRLWERDHFLERSNADNLAQGAVAGVLLVMMAYNLFIFLSTRDGNYLLYIGFVASYFLFYFTLTGYSYAYLWPGAVRWNSFAISTFIAASTLFTCWFAISFLRLKGFSLLAYRTMLAFAVAGGALLVLSFVLPYAWTVRMGASLTMPVALAALWVGYWRWWRGAHFARFYCLAWTSVLLGLGVLNANKLGLIAVNVWTNNASQLGVMLQMVLLSFTLADRINHERARRIAAQEEALAHERHARASAQALAHATEAANRELERKVAERTADLNTTMAQLQDANAQLQRLSTTDALTQLRNRAYFDQTLALEARRALRQHTPLSLILFDIDHFKHVNDTWGHPAGDACLRALADTVSRCLGRAGDVLARYGGEEFVALLPDTALPQALALAETLRQAVQEQTVLFEGQSLRYTASFGVATLQDGGIASAGALVAGADLALYQAKHDGRNCVRSV